MIIVHISTIQNSLNLSAFRLVVLIYRKGKIEIDLLCEGLQSLIYLKEIITSIVLAFQLQDSHLRNFYIKITTMKLIIINHFRGQIWVGIKHRWRKFQDLKMILLKLQARRIYRRLLYQVWGLKWKGVLRKKQKTGIQLR